MGSKEGSGTVMRSSHSRKNVKGGGGVAGVGVWGVGEQAAAHMQSSGRSPWKLPRGRRRRRGESCAPPCLRQAPRSLGSPVTGGVEAGVEAGGGTEAEGGAEAESRRVRGTRHQLKGHGPRSRLPRKSRAGTASRLWAVCARQAPHAPPHQHPPRPPRPPRPHPHRQVRRRRRRRQRRRGGLRARRAWRTA